MARSDTLRSEIARLQDKKASLGKEIATQERAAASAREAARKKRDQAARSKSTPTIRSQLSSAEREDKKVAAAEAKIAKDRKDQAATDKTIASKSTSIASAEAPKGRRRMPRTRGTTHDGAARSSRSPACARQHPANAGPLRTAPAP